MTKYLVYLLDGGKWKMIRCTENLPVAMALCQKNRQNGYLSNIEDEYGHFVYGDK